MRWRETVRKRRKINVFGRSGASDMTKAAISGNINTVICDLNDADNRLHEKNPNIKDITEDISIVLESLYQIHDKLAEIDERG